MRSRCAVFTGRCSEPSVLDDLGGDVALSGIWVRESRSTDGGPFWEPSDVFWLQAGPYFADVRSPRAEEPVEHALDQAQAFAGIVIVDFPWITWCHDLDTQPRPAGHRDTATLEPFGPCLIERGPGYEEHWLRTAGPDSHQAVVELEASEGPRRLVARVVQVGTTAAGVWCCGAGTGGALFTYDTHWVPRFCCGEEGLLARAGDVLAALTAGKTPADDWQRAL
jgi:hypothetical protein